MPLTTPPPAQSTQSRIASTTALSSIREIGADPTTLWRRYARSGPGSAVEDEVVEQYLPLVRAVVNRVAMSLPTHVSGEDLYSAGLVGLLNAVRRFNPKSGASFETYARVR
ncbi:MAG: hypothetical protein L0Z50_08830, partial [Verrucomicrobiales bacterium]|nr:hypothetical protein [Verrucomicrobiales bacterium]